MLDDRTGEHGEGQVESIAHGVIVLEHLANQYGAERRRLRVSKVRGVAFRGGYHDFMIRRGGLDVFARLVSAEHQGDFPDETLASGNAPLDLLLGGGLPLGTSTLLLGPAGTGKSTIASQFAVAAADKGLRAAVYVFDENVTTFRSRSRKLGIGVEPHMKSGAMSVQQVDPAELSPGEFVTIVRALWRGTDSNGIPAKVVIIDSLNGYLNAMTEEKFLTAQMHELLGFLGRKGVVTILTVTQSGLIGDSNLSPVDTTYLADNVILFRYFESRGRVRRAISVIKKRNGRHEPTIREMYVTEKGLEIGEPLEDFQGVLTGVPTYIGDPSDLRTRDGDGR